MEKTSTYISKTGQRKGGDEVVLKDTPLKIRYAESKEWLETLEFRKQEMDFLGNLLINKVLDEGMTSRYGKMIEILGKIHRNLFDYLEADIIAHENILSKYIIAQKRLNNGDLTQHYFLKERMGLLTTDFRTFKKTIFEYVKEL